MSKRLLYLEDLYSFYSSLGKSVHFSSNETKEPLVVQVVGKLTFDCEKHQEGLKSVHLQSCHTDLNVNNSNIKMEVMENAIPSFSNRPILGFIHEVNGQLEFYDHRTHKENDELVYDEIPVGIIPESCNAKIVYDEDKKKHYVEVDGYIFEEYSKASEILEREGECAVSVELSVRELSYNAKEKYLDIEDFYFSGVTILGKTPNGQEVKPGMQGSNIKLTDFSQKNNSLFANLDSLNEKMDILLSHFNDINQSTEEGGNAGMENDKLLNSTNDTTSQDYEPENENTATASVENTDDNTENENSTSKSFDVLVRKYELSHDDIKYGLYNLLSSYEAADNDWYFIEQVYDDHFVYSNWEGTKTYGQKYLKDGNNVSYDGERYELFKELLTEAEKVQLEEMRANYSAIMSELEKYRSKELEAKREELFDSDDYKGIRNTEEFIALKAEHSNYSIEELTNKLDKIISNSIKNKTYNFSANDAESKAVKKKSILFNHESKEEPKKDSFLQGLLSL